MATAGGDAPRSTGDPIVLTLPGYTGAGPQHWLTHWERLHPGVVRVEQDDWDRPDPQHWIARLDAVLDATAVGPARIVIAAHSLGCLLLVHWCRVSMHAPRVAGALLVAPPDVEQRGTPPELLGFAPIPLRPLPFRSILVASSADVWASPARAQEFARAWRSTFVDAGEVGHLDSLAGLDAWPAGWALLQSLARAATPA